MARFSLIFIYLLVYLLGSTMLSSQEDSGSLEWITDLGIVSKRKGWRRLEQQDCSKARNLDAGDAKQICKENPTAKYVQEYFFKFSYLPDNIDTKFPFGVPLDFQLRIDKVQTDEQYFWLVTLSNRSEGSTISFYQKKAQGEVQEPELKQKIRQELRKLRKKEEQEALYFLKEYFSCLRQNRKC